MKPEKIYFKGAGIITATGNNFEETIAAIEKKNYKPSVLSVKLTNDSVDIPYFTIKQPNILQGTERIYQIIDSVIQQAIDEAKLSIEQLEQAGLFVGSTSFDMFTFETALKNSSCIDKDIATHTPSFNRLTNYIQKKYNINGPVYTFNTACTSSANALIYAAEFIRRRDISHAIVLGLEFFNEVTALGFSSLELISKTNMKPFNKQRDGLHLGEGCGALIISAEPEANGCAYLAGANLGDNYSMTASNPEGSIVQTVIEHTLLQANIEKKDIAIIKTHGTASLSNDEAEAAGLSKVFGDLTPPIVALKPFIGHTLGACGINELILFYKTIQQKKLLTYPGRISAEFSLKLASNNDIPDKGYYLLNYFGFGGNSTTLVITNA